MSACRRSNPAADAAPVEVSYACLSLRLSAVALACAALSAVAAKADVIYTLTETGTITSGTSAGTFGANGTNLAGDTYTATLSFDATQSTYNSGSQENSLAPATSSGTVTVAGYTYNILLSNYYYNAGFFPYDNEMVIDSIAGGASEDQIIGRTYDTTGHSVFYSNVSSNTEFLSSDSLSQVTNLSVSASMTTSAQFEALDNTSFRGTVGTISINAGAAAASVPEPQSVALFGAGLAAMLWLRRRAMA